MKDKKILSIFLCMLLLINITSTVYAEEEDNQGGETLRDIYEKEQNEYNYDETEIARQNELRNVYNQVEQSMRTESHQLENENSYEDFYSGAYIENGKLLRFTEGTSKNQSSAYQELNETIVSDQEELFREFFK